MRFFAPFVFLFISSLCLGSSKIAFLETYDGKGNIVQYEPGGRFSHSAISIGEGESQKWLNAYPKEGVAVISWERLSGHGRISRIVEIPQSISEDQLGPFLGLPFDYWYSWTNDAIYCSELIAKLLNIQPEPMILNHQVWPPQYWKLEGQPGMSPDNLYRKLTGKNVWD